MNRVMKVVGVLFVLMGAIWFLQGANVLTAGRSFMIGDPRWEVYGGITVLVGVALLVFAGRKRNGF